MTHLYLIWHAQADRLKPGINGSAIPNAGLSVQGVTQAERLRDRQAASGEIRADVLISSPLLRAKETAAIIAPALGLPVRIEDEVQEFNLGECEGLTDEEIGERWGLFHIDKEPFRRVAPSGDSWTEFVMRGCRALDRISREYTGKTIVIVCHGRMIEASFTYCFQLDIWSQRPIMVENASITH
ncbi:MAG: histidine phosphatase family protein [Chloroflexota bacterium]|nr:histidine phosphatase family protein [Chloroflexota bacterium]